MESLDKYDSTTERVENGTVLERFLKFEKISNLLLKEGIEIVSVGSHTVDLEDNLCGFKLSHNIITWEIFRVVDVVDMIINTRNKHKNK